MNKPLRVDKLIGGGKYASLLSRAKELVALDRLLHELIPAPLNDHCRVLAIRDATLVLAADSPVWAARLRFHAPQLVKQFSRHQTVTVRTVRIRVRPPARPLPPERRLPAIRRTARGAAVLQQAAQTVSDPGLKSALLRLASRQNNR